MKKFVLLALFCCATNAGASVVAVSLPAQLEIWSNTIPTFWPKDVDGNGTVDFTFAASYGQSGLRTERSNRILIFVSPPPDLGGPVEAFDRGDLIGDHFTLPLAFYNSDFHGDGFVEQDEMEFTAVGICLSPGCIFSPFAGRRAYAGFEFERDGLKHYGYFDWSMAEQAEGFQLYGWAWETEPGRPIVAGAVPEPGCMAMGAMAGARLLHRRRRRKE